MKNTNVFSLAALLLCTILLFSCAGVSTPNGVFTERLETTDDVTNLIQIELENGGIIRVALYPDVAPATTANFQKLVSAHFYDGTIFHRVIANFMIQGGDPEGTGYGGAAENVIGEFAQNGYSNSLSHKRGVISMARNGYDMNSASSQFFIVHADSPHLDGAYAAFGAVVAGMETVDWIAQQPTNANDKPLENITIKQIRFVPEQ